MHFSSLLRQLVASLMLYLAARWFHFMASVAFLTRPAPNAQQRVQLAL